MFIQLLFATVCSTYSTVASPQGQQSPGRSIVPLELQGIELLSPFPFRQLSAQRRELVKREQSPASPALRTLSLLTAPSVSLLKQPTPRIPSQPKVSVLTHSVPSVSTNSNDAIVNSTFEEDSPFPGTVITLPPALNGNETEVAEAIALETTKVLGTVKVANESETESRNRSSLNSFANVLLSANHNETTENDFLEPGEEVGEAEEQILKLLNTNQTSNFNETLDSTPTKNLLNSVNAIKSASTHALPTNMNKSSTRTSILTTTGPKSITTSAVSPSTTVGVVVAHRARNSASTPISKHQASAPLAANTEIQAGNNLAAAAGPASLIQVKVVSGKTLKGFDFKTTAETKENNTNKLTVPNKSKTSSSTLSQKRSFSLAESGQQPLQSLVSSAVNQSKQATPLAIDQSVLSTLSASQSKPSPIYRVRLIVNGHKIVMNVNYQADPQVVDIYDFRVRWLVPDNWKDDGDEAKRRYEVVCWIEHGSDIRYLMNRLVSGYYDGYSEKFQFPPNYQGILQCKIRARNSLDVFNEFKFSGRIDLQSIPIYFPGSEGLDLRGLSTEDILSVLRKVAKSESHAQPALNVAVVTANETHTTNTPVVV